VSILIAALVLGAAIVLPHMLRLERAPPGFAAAVWGSALALRALGSLCLAVLLEVLLPATKVWAPLSTWCVRPPLPFAHGDPGVSAHAVGDFLLAIPTFALAASLIAMLFVLWRAARRVRVLVRGSVVGSGPDESLVVADGAMLVAAAGIRRPRVLVSAGALLALDDEELAASLDHERGHIVRGHRYVLVLAELARSLARFMPGTRAAARELMFHLERDADRYALERRHDPAVLASAICKAAQDRSPGVPTLGLGGGVVTRRIRLLLDTGLGPSTRGQGALMTVAPVLIALVVAAGAVALPFVAHDAFHVRHQGAAQCGEPT
jgi:Zn-dependent protease with chaperone function